MERDRLNKVIEIVKVEVEELHNKLCGKVGYLGSLENDVFRIDDALEKLKKVR